MFTPTIDHLERKLYRSVQRFSSIEILRNLSATLKNEYRRQAATVNLYQNGNPGMMPFQAAAIALYAMRCCKPDARKNNAMTPEDLRRMCFDFNRYLLADPIGYNAELREQFYKENPVMMMLRLKYSQFRYSVLCPNTLGRAILMYDQLPSGLVTKGAKFDFYEKFRSQNGTTIMNFLLTCELLKRFFSQANTHELSKNKFADWLRENRIQFDLNDFRPTLTAIGGTPTSFKEEYKKRANSDKRFRIYNYNPIVQFPVLRPWGEKGDIFDSELYCPISDILALRQTAGVYYQLLDAYGNDFTTYFGDLFEYYVGSILKESVQSASKIISEDVIRQTYPSKRGKAPDFVVIENNRAILIECKATRFLLPALVTGDENYFTSSLEKTVNGIQQLFEFEKAVRQKEKGLELFADCKELIPVVVTFEPLHLIENEFGQAFLNLQLASSKEITDYHCQIVSIGELEEIQPHVRNFITLGDALLLRESCVSDTQYFHELKRQTGVSASQDSVLTKIAEQYCREKL